MSGNVDELFLDSKKYISVKRAASICGYTTDYVGQLCRGNKIDATRVGRNWYVHEDSIIGHKNGQIEPNNRPKRVREAPSQAIQRSGVFRDDFILYFEDERPLIPVLGAITEPDSVTIPIAKPKIATNQHESIIIEAKIAKPTIFEAYAVLKRQFALVAVFLLVFVGFFTLNGSYTASLLGDGVAAVVATEFGQTTQAELIAPYERVALEINQKIDSAIYTYLYE